MNTVLKVGVFCTSAHALDLVSALTAAEFLQPEWKNPLDYFEAADVVNAKHNINEAYLHAREVEEEQILKTQEALVQAQTAVTDARLARAEAWTTFASQSNTAYEDLDPDVRLTYEETYIEEMSDEHYNAVYGDRDAELAEQEGEDAEEV